MTFRDMPIRQKLAPLLTNFVSQIFARMQSSGGPLFDVGREPIAVRRFPFAP
jgi:hypothetical protein